MYSKVVLTLEQSEKLYKEPVVEGVNGRIILKTSRDFQEYLEVKDFGDGRAISKGEVLRVDLDFPNYVPLRDPLQNWFQVALSDKSDILVDPLDCSARYKGALPGILCLQDPPPITFEEDKRGGRKYYVPKTPTVTFVLEDDPAEQMADYMLFIYDSADYNAFIDGVANLLGGSLNKGRTVVSDPYGNKVMVSDNSAQPMLLIPISLLIGGRDYIYDTWEHILKK